MPLRTAAPAERPVHALLARLGRAARRPRSPVPLAVFRVLFALCLVLEVRSFLVHAALWFGPLPADAPAAGSGWQAASEAGVVAMRLALWVWLAAAFGLLFGAWTRASATVNYICCVASLGFNGMPGNYEYHPDHLYLGLSLALLFLPVSRVLSIDARRRPPRERAVGAWTSAVLVVIASDIYFDSALWKLSSHMWMEGLGYFSPASQPLDAPLKLAWTLEAELVARAASYVTLVYELVFPFLVWVRVARVPLLLIGFALHVGIGTALPIPVFGLLMVAVLAGVVSLPVKRSDETTDEALAPPRFAGALLAVWACVFALGALEPLQALARYGVGGIDGGIPRPWHVERGGLAGRAVGSAQTWGYRLAGWRTHPVFLDSQFATFDATTRLRYVAPNGEVGGRLLDQPLRDRRWLVWNNRMAWPDLPREEAERQLLRVVAFHGARLGLDLERGHVRVEQRRTRVPTRAWEPGALGANLAAEWQTVGWIRRGAAGLGARWDRPCWLPSPAVDRLSRPLASAR